MTATNYSSNTRAVVSRIRKGSRPSKMLFEGPEDVLTFEALLLGAPHPPCRRSTAEAQQPWDESCIPVEELV